MHTPAKRQFLCKCNENCRRHTLCLARQFEAVSCQNNAFLQAMFYCAEHPNAFPFFIVGDGVPDVPFDIIYIVRYNKTDNIKTLILKGFAYSDDLQY